MSHPSSTLLGRFGALALLLCLSLAAWSGEVVSAVYPNSAPLGSSATVVIVGTGFSGTPAVTIDGTPCTGVTVDSATQITATIAVPGGSTTGVKDVVVATSAAFNGFTFVQTATATVQVTITASITSSLAVCWAGTTTGKTEGDTSAVAWTLGALAAGATRHTNSAVASPDVLDFVVRNVGNGPQKFVVSAASPSVPASGAITWALGAMPGSNISALAVSDGANIPTPTWVSMTAAAAGRTLNSNATVAVNGTAAFDLQFKAPLWDTSAVSQTMTVTVTATP